MTTNAPADQAAPVTVPGSLTIGALARHTDLDPQVLRAWETRHGFPVPRRTPSGHRRYSEADVAAVQRVLAMKAAGIRLEQAIARVQREDALRDAPSVYAELRRRHPALPLRRLGRRTLVGLSRAIEDEAVSRGGRPLVFGAFQRGEFYRRSGHRWREFNRTARLCVVFAAFDDPSHPGDPQRVDLPADALMLREWTVVVASPYFAAVLAAWEIPGLGRGAPRTFESIFSVDPAAVRTATEVCLATAESAGIETGVTLDDHLPPSVDTAAVDALMHRALGYLDALV